MWVPVDTARRTVRSGRSETVRIVSASCHRSVSRSITVGVGSRATMAPLRAPTLVPEHQVGGDPHLEQRAQHPDLGRPEHPTAPEHERRRHVAIVG